MAKPNTKEIQMYTSYVKKYDSDAAVLQRLNVELTREKGQTQTSQVVKLSEIAIDPQFAVLQAMGSQSSATPYKILDPVLSLDGRLAYVEISRGRWNCSFYFLQKVKGDWKVAVAEAIPDIRGLS